jgi:hypothetical protein
MGNLVSSHIPSLFNGVSQQPPTLRVPSQSEAQVNTYSTVANGVRKRPGFENVSKVSDTALDGSYIHTINRDADEKYIVVITDGDLRVFDIDGTEQTVNFPAGKDYLNNSDPVRGFSVVSIADYSFVVNKSVTVAVKQAPSTQPPGISSGDLFLPSGWVDPDSLQAEVQSLYFAPPIELAKREGKVQTFEKLPTAEDDNPPSNGDWWIVSGYDENSFGTFYVQRVGGVWEESFLLSYMDGTNGYSKTLDEATMPHGLVRMPDGTFEFKPFAWPVRKVGDELSNPPPSFVGQTISDIFYYKNRLGVLAGESVVFSEAGGYGNFWRTTVTDLLDSDPVDVAVSSTKVSILRYAVPFQNHLMLFADQTQFTLNVDELLTPTSVSIDVVTEYSMNSRVRPVGIGPDVYFVTPVGDHSRVREYFVHRDNDLSQNSATDVTAHVPSYLPKEIFDLAGNSNEDVLFALSDEAGHQNRIYVYKFFFDGEGRVQSAWSYWELDEGDTILMVEALDNKVYALIERADGVYLEAADLQAELVTDALSFQILLDRLDSVTGSYDGIEDETTLTLPYPVPAGTQRDNFRIVRGSGFGAQSGALCDPSQYEWINNTTVKVPGDETAGLLWFGVGYTMEYEFSEQFVMNGDRAVTTGRLQLRTFVVYYTGTAYFQTSVAPYGTDPLVEDVVPANLSAFTGKTIGNEALQLGTPIFDEGKYAFQIYGSSRDAKVKLMNDSHVQSIFTSAEWEGMYHNRARVI